MRVRAQLARDHAHVVLDAGGDPVDRVVGLEHWEIDEAESLTRVGRALRIPDAVLEAHERPRVGLELRIRGPALHLGIVLADDVTVAEVALGVLLHVGVADGRPVEVRDVVPEVLEPDHHVMWRERDVLCVVLHTVESRGGSELGVLAHHDLAGETVWMIDDPPDQPTQQIRVRPPTLRPLIVDLDQNEVIASDDAIRPRQRALDRGTIEFETIAPHDREQVVQSDQSIARGILRALGHVIELGAIVARRIEDGTGVRFGARLKRLRCDERDRTQSQRRKSERRSQPTTRSASGEKERGDERSAEDHGRSDRSLLAGVAHPARLRAATKKKPGEREGAGHDRRPGQA